MTTKATELAQLANAISVNSNNEIDFASTLSIAAITGSAIDGTSIGTVTPSTISGTTGSFSGDLIIADKIVHSGDTNTAIRFPAADTVTVETGGFERIRVDSAGNVGIGTNSPAQTLTVNGTIGGTIIASQIEAQDGTSTTKLMTPQRVEQHMLANGMGYGNTIATVEYAASTWYQNTTGRPVYLNVRSSGTAGSHSFDYGSDTTTFNTFAVGDGSSGTWSTLSLVWLPNWYLRLGFSISISNMSWEVR